MPVSKFCEATDENKPNGLCGNPKRWKDKETKKCYCDWHKHLLTDGRGSKKKKKSKPKKEALVSMKKMREYTWWFFSLSIRLRDADEDGNTFCCTCPPEKQNPIYYIGTGVCQAGHFIPQSANGPTRYHRQNVHAQCMGCNGPFGQGRQYEHGKYVNEKYGDGTAEMLQQKSREFIKIDRVYLLEVLRESCRLVESESKQKNLWDWKDNMAKKTKVYAKIYDFATQGKVFDFLGEKFI